MSFIAGQKGCISNPHCTENSVERPREDRWVGGARLQSTTRIPVCSGHNNRVIKMETFHVDRDNLPYRALTALFRGCWSHSHSARMTEARRFGSA